MILLYLITQFKGVVIVSIPLIILAILKPEVFNYYSAIVICSLAMGCYITYLNYITTKQQADVLLFVPSGECKAAFDQEINRCTLSPDAIRLRYGYCDDMIAQTIFNTVKVDPRMWKDIDADPKVAEVVQIIKNHIMPGVPEDKKNLHDKIAVALTAPAQRFIFRHELGHVYNKSVIKRLGVIALVGTLAAFIGIAGATLFLGSLPGFFVVLIGMFFGGCADLFLSHGSKAIFNYHDEKRADLFAVRHSSAEEILAAAQFFENYQTYADDYKRESMGLLANIPQAILSGHPDGKVRASYLRKLASNN
ncbi:MAG: M48 family metalloprotease [bacterium]|nr:M48 family metalloprotease [bacterium]